MRLKDQPKRLGKRAARERNRVRANETASHAMLTGDGSGWRWRWLPKIGRRAWDPCWRPS